jgi:hypothetical protein
MASFFAGLTGTFCDLTIKLKDMDSLPTSLYKTEDGGVEELFVFSGEDPVAGEVVVELKGKKMDHVGIKIELIGHIELLYDRGNPYEFISLVRELESANDSPLTGNKVFPFEFTNVDKAFESYVGNNVKLRYFLRAKITRSYSANIVKERTFAVQKLGSEPSINSSIKMEVGIEDCLHIEFEYNKSTYHLQDVVIGKIYFLLVKIKIKHMELVVIKRESTGNGQNMYNESENIAKFEIMDGAPVECESIPVRLFLAPNKLGPTFPSVHNRFSVKYYLNLVLVDVDDRRYFKQQEIHLYRKALTVTKNAPNFTPIHEKLYSPETS